MIDVDDLKRRLIAEVIQREGGFSNRPEDRGGPTNWGITLATAREHGYTGDMRALPRSLAASIYAGRYWHSLELDAIAQLSPDLATVMFDFGVNSGTGRPGEYLQVQLNVLNDRGRLYEDIVVDGAVGNNTLTALRSFAGVRGEYGLSLLAQTMNAERIVFCRRLAERDEEQEIFAYGWFSRVVDLLANVLHQQPVPSQWLNEVAT